MDKHYTTLSLSCCNIAVGNFYPISECTANFRQIFLMLLMVYIIGKPSQDNCLEFVQCKQHVGCDCDSLEIHNSKGYTDQTVIGNTGILLTYRKLE